MTEQELRALVREAIARHTAGLGGVASPGAYSGVPAQAGSSNPMRLVQHHASHALFVLPAGADMDGPCLIEPAVPCNHCGYCKSYGH